MGAIRSDKMKRAVQLCTDPNPARRISAYAAAKLCGVTQSAISQDRIYRKWKDAQK